MNYFKAYFYSKTTTITAFNNKIALVKCAYQKIFQQSIYMEFK